MTDIKIINPCKSKPVKFADIALGQWFCTFNNRNVIYCKVGVRQCLMIEEGCVSQLVSEQAMIITNAENFNITMLDKVTITVAK